jgi:FkbH-like protein
MILRRSQFVHLIPFGCGRELLIHAVAGARMIVEADVADVVRYFDVSRSADVAISDLAARLSLPTDTVGSAVSALLAREILCRLSPDDEIAAVRAALDFGSTRDPVKCLERYQRARSERGIDYWAVSAARTVRDFRSDLPEFRVVLLGDCDVQTEIDFLRAAGVYCGMDLRVSATFLDDTREVLASPPDALIIGALPGRHAIAMGTAAAHGGQPWGFWMSEAREAIRRVREATTAPIVIDNLPIPTVQPLGFADRGRHSHRNRFRQANLELAEMVGEFADVYVSDIEAALAEAGSAALVDDSLVAFTHFGSPGWMLQRPPAELVAVHGLFPPLDGLAAQTGGDPYRREKVAAREHAAILASIFRVGRKKCVIVDLDGTLWPGALAETGEPFRWHPEVSSPYSYVGLYFGLHEALRTLKRRGIVLACVSKNDEATVRELWRYDDHYPHDRLLTPADFVSLRINWEDKPANILSIAAQLGFSLDCFVFVDDNPVERERVRRVIPEVLVLGDDPFQLRRQLLTDPRLQSPAITPESANRSELVMAQIRRAKLRLSAPDEQAFLESLKLSCDVCRLAPGDEVERIRELFERTTQFNTTGRKFTNEELSSLVLNSQNHVFALRLKDRFTDHGMVGACVVEAGEISALAVSCRALGLGVEHRFMHAVLSELAANRAEITARLIRTSRNQPSRRIFADHQFEEREEGRWWLDMAQLRTAHEPSAFLHRAGPRA